LKIKTLEHIEFETIITCFLSAFENYFVQLPTDKAYYKERWKIAKVNYQLSYGMFDGEQLVGFIIHAVDNRDGELIAFNTGTGVLPKYRGQKITKAIYNYALPDLKENGITKCLLEVITANKAAISAYENVGFEIIKNYKCFNGILNLNTAEPVVLKEINFNEINWKEISNLNSYSWDNQKETIQNSSYKYFQIINNQRVESYFVINPTNGYISQWDVLTTNKEAWENLFDGIKQISNTVIINNVEERLTNKINFLHSIGLDNTVNQYEMKLTI